MSALDTSTEPIKEKPFFLRNMALAMASRIVVGGSSVVVAMLLANGFDSDAFSSFRFYQLTLSMLVAVAGPGISLSASKLFAQFNGAGATGAPPIGLFWAVGLSLAVLVAAALPLFPGRFIADDIPVSVWLLSLGLFLSAAAIVPLGAMIGLELFGWLLAIDVTTAAILLLGAGLAISQGNMDIAIWFMVGGHLLALLLATYLVLRIIPFRTILSNAITQSRLADLRRIAGIAGPNAVISIVMSFQYWGVARIILSSSPDPRVFAAFSIGLQWFALANMVPDVIGRIVFPRAVRLSMASGQEDRRQRKKLALKAIGLVVASTVAVALFAYLSGPYIIQLYGSNYRDETFLIGIFATASIPYSLACSIGFQVLARDGERTWMILSLVQLTVTIAACLLFVDLGAAAGAVALAAGGLAVSVLGFIAARNRDVF